MFEGRFTANEATPQVQLAYSEAKQIWEDADDSIRTEVIETGGTPRTESFVSAMEKYLGTKYGLASEDLMLLVESAAWSASPGVTEKLLDTFHAVRRALDE